MKKSYLRLVVLLAAVTLLHSCISFNFSQLERSQTGVQKLPPLEPVFDLKSFGVTYSDLYDIPTDLVSGGINPESVVRNVTQTLKTAEDTKRIYESFVVKNLCSGVGDTRGSAVCRMGLRSRGIESWVNPAVSILTLGIANIFGMKYATYEDNLEIYVDIENIDGKVIGSYVGFGVGKAQAQPYKGYRLRDARRMAHARAFRAAIEDGQAQMIGEKAALVELLSI